MKTTLTRYSLPWSTQPCPPPTITSPSQESQAHKTPSTDSSNAVATSWETIVLAASLSWWVNSAPSASTRSAACCNSKAVSSNKITLRFWVWRTRPRWSRNVDRRLGMTRTRWLGEMLCWLLVGLVMVGPTRPIGRVTQGMSRVWRSA